MKRRNLYKQYSVLTLGIMRRELASGLDEFPCSKPRMRIRWVAVSIYKR